MEHAFAALKGWFQSLRELHLQIHTERDLQIAVYWVECCLILHNMIICFESALGVESTAGWAMDEGREPDHRLNPVVVDVPEGSPGQQFHGELTRHLFTHLNMLE